MLLVRYMWASMTFWPIISYDSIDNVCFRIKLYQFIVAVLYSAANDPETANDPRPEMIPKLDRK